MERLELIPGTFLTKSQVAQRLVDFEDWPSHLYAFPEPVQTNDGPMWKAEDIIRLEIHLSDTLIGE